MKRIVITLDEKSINSALQELKAYKKELSRKAALLVRRLVDEGVNIAKQEVISLGAFDSGELANSIDGLMYADGKRGIIFTNCAHAAFVEFGTGVVGAAAQHPTLPWQYDVNNHGEAGWIYWDDVQGRLRWTKGMPSRPFMYNTAKELEQKAITIAREVWKA